MSDKLCHCVARVVASPIEREVSPLEYADDIGRAASSEGAHSSREPSEYFEPPTGAEVKVVVVPEVEELVEITDRDAEGSLVTSEVERESAGCRCTPAIPVIAEDVVMRLEDVSPRLLSVDEEAPPSYLVSRQRCVRSSGRIRSRYRSPYHRPTHFLGQDLRFSSARNLRSEYLRQRRTGGLAERSTPAGYWAESDRGSDDSDVGTVDRWDSYWPSCTGIGYDVQRHVQPQ